MIRLDTITFVLHMSVYDRHGALLFQSNKREVDISLVQTFYDWNLFLKNTFIGPVGYYDFHFISGVPQEVQKWLTVIRPFDIYIWAFLLASWVAVTIALIYINKIYSSWLKGSTKDTPYQSNFFNLIVYTFKLYHVFNYFSLLVYLHMHNR